MPEKNRIKPCPACGGKYVFNRYCPASFLKGDERWIMDCGYCGLSVLWPLPTGNEIKTYYNVGYYDFNRNSEEGKGYYYARLLRRIKEKGRFLDIGCATGFFLNGIRRHCSWEVFGQETGKDAAAYARQKLGLNVKGVPLEKARYPRDFFDYIHLNNVLEHVLEPADMMAEVGRILKPGGCLYLAVPNGKVDRYGYRDYHQRLGGKAASKDGHLYFFSPASISLITQKAGLRIEKVYSCGLKRSLRNLGFWPRKRGWEKPYEGRGPSARSVEQAITVGRSYPRLYYLYKHGMEHLLRFPGFSNWAYDFNIYLTK